MMDDDDVKLLHLGWEDVQSLAEKLALKIAKSAFAPDLIVAVSRGGFDPARILCDQLSIRRLASLQIEFYSGVKNRLGPPKIVFPLNADVHGLRALVVDDVSDSGNSLKVAKEHVAGRGASEVRVATLHVKPWTAFMPDYYASEVDAWIVYPWEPRESLISMAERLRRRGLVEEDVRRRLVGLGFRPELVSSLV